MAVTRRSRSSARALRQYLMVAAAIVLLLLLACAPAWAGDPLPAPAPAPDPTVAPVAPVAAPPAEQWRRRERVEETSWYGWQVLVADGASLIVLPIGAGVSQSEILGFAALGGYLLAPPIMHGARGRWGIAAASLGLRLGVPTVGLLLGAAVDSESCRGGDFCVEAGAALGFVAGILGAVALDASLLSFEKVDVDAASDDRAKRRGFAFTPTFTPRKDGGFAFGLGATF